MMIYPLIIAGGPCAYNVEPMADFFDLVVMGEGEEVTHELSGPFFWTVGNKQELKTGLSFVYRAASIKGCLRSQVL
jgi:hypothetical protein